MQRVLRREPTVVLWIDPTLPGAGHHGAELEHRIQQQQGFTAELLPCADLGRLAALCRDGLRPDLLYVLAHADLNLGDLAGALGDGLPDGVPLLVLNLLGEGQPVPPPALLAGRQVLCTVHGAAGEGPRSAREAGVRWFTALFAGADDPTQAAYRAFGPALRHWSGDVDLTLDLATTRGEAFRTHLIRLLLDRVSARREISDEVAAALGRGTPVLALLAAGTASDRPGLLMEQVWHHYQAHRPPTNPDQIRPYRLHPAGLPTADDLLVLFAPLLGRTADDWQDGLDQLANRCRGDERLILWLAWHLGPAPEDVDPELWQRDWLTAWLDLGVRHLAGWRRTGVLLVNTLVVEAATLPSPTDWTEALSGLLSEPKVQREVLASGQVSLELEPLSKVPEKDLRYFFERHYELARRHPALDPRALARWVHQQTNTGNFAAAVDLVERLNETGFDAAYEHFGIDPPRPDPDPDPSPAR